MCDVDSRAEALADYRRVKSDAWSGDEPSLPRHMFFNDPRIASRNFVTGCLTTDVTGSHSILVCLPVFYRF
jgi:hypothetical protein